MPLGEIAEVKGGITLNKAREVEDPVEVPYLRVANVQRGHLDLSELKRVVIAKNRLDDYLLQPGDILFNEGGDRDKLGRGWVWNGEIPGCCHQNHVFRARPDRERVDSKFVSYWANEFGRAYFEREGKQTTNLASINRAKLCALPIPLPPLAEQRRIVARIEELFSRLDAGVAALRHAKAQLQRYRQSVLAAAVTGQLTQAWREQHPDTEPATALRQCLLETRQLRWTGKYDSPVPTALEQSWAIPASWAWMSADELIREPLKNGLSLKGFANPPGVAVLKLDALREGGLDYSKRQYLRTDSPKVAEIQIEKGDFLISRGNGSLRLLAKGVLADVAPDNVIFPDTMIRFRFPPALQRWIAVAWRSRVVREQIEGRAKSTAGIYKIAQGDLRPIAIPIPPLAEQHQIVAEVEARTTAIDHLEAELDRQITRSKRLRQSTLATAFQGGLLDMDGELARS